MPAPKILAFSGSLREGSFNQKLVNVAAGGARDAGAEVTVLDLRDLDLPLYSGDLEAKEGLPEGALKLKAILKEHDGFLIASPEHNSSISAGLKNAIDWASRPMEGETPLECFRGKVAGVMSASPGGLGGLRGLVHLRAILQNIHTMVITDQRAVGGAANAFGDNGTLKDPKLQGSVEQIGANLATMLAKHTA